MIMYQEIKLGLLGYEIWNELYDGCEKKEEEERKEKKEEKKL